MRIEVVSDAEQIAERAVRAIEDLIAAQPRGLLGANLGLPTGQTPVRLYAKISSLDARREFDADGARAFAIDEFVGVPNGSAGTNAAFFAKNLDVPFRTIRIPDSGAPDANAEIAAFADAVGRAGGLDLCILGIGTNGHVAFNEPGSGIDSRARVVELTEESRRAHAEAFGSLDAVPRRGVTLGIADILESRSILVLAQGPSKAAIVARAIEGSQTADVPASWLQVHGDVTWLLDAAAASKLSDEARRGTQPPPAI